ncbi:MAG: hypothetical protein HDT30_05495 [Clostridiales bacterium]|nr:hypothetical protein [Clostridiales bacterium]
MIQILKKSYSDRKKEILQKEMEGITTLVESKMITLLNEMEVENEKYSRDFILALEQVFLECIEFQKLKIKEPIEFVTIYFLRSSIVTGSFDFLIQLYDENFLWDEVNVEGIWTPQWLLQEYLSTINEVKIKIKHDILGFYDSDIDFLNLEIGESFMRLMLTFVNNQIEKIIELENFRKMKTNPKFKIVFGDIYGRLVTIYSNQSEKRGVG